MPIRTVFDITQDCALDRRQGWAEFVREYAGMVRALLQHYFPSLRPELDRHVLGALQRFRGNGGAWFRDLHFANEREFLMDFRAQVLAYGREQEAAPAASLSLAQVRVLMAEFTVIEREMLWLFVKGYTAEQIAAMVLNAAATSQAAKNKADQKLSAMLPGADAASLPRSARALLLEAEAAKSENCLPWKTYNNLINGQLSWRERDLAEQHIAECFYCLDRFTSFQEMVRLRKDSAPLAEPQVEATLDAMGIPKARGLFAKLLAR